MNQILVTKVQNSPVLSIKKTLFKIQLLLSIFLITILVYYYFNKYYSDFKSENSSNIIHQSLSTLSLYDNKSVTQNNTYIGIIKIEKINIEYPVFSEFNYDALKISPCRFHGSFDDNLCVVAHNYNDYRFFSKINELNFNDIIQIYDLDR